MSVGVFFAVVFPLFLLGVAEITGDFVSGFIRREETPAALQRRLAREAVEHRQRLNELVATMEDCTA